ncbi:FCN2 [Cordylochernes scorpioides]|uniref:FCN2 n=1 Tax=Cordylochernes scorpioides TaxID=51811 RepID=A0ABY6LRE8_9ARAC|nr:FCN2 [Cordylochernes scorpioides]
MLMVFQRRGQFGNPKEYFLREWSDYKRGFGNLEKEFWLGNGVLSQITSRDHWQLRVDLWDVNGTHVYATYEDFWIEDEAYKYKLHLSNYKGTAGDALSDAHNGKKWSTTDQDNDTYNTSCSALFKGAWWYGSCHHANLNGINYNGPHESYADGIDWKPFAGYHMSLAKTEMKIRPHNMNFK